MSWSIGLGDKQRFYLIHRFVAEFLIDFDEEKKEKTGLSAKTSSLMYKILKKVIKKFRAKSVEEYNSQKQM